MHALLLVAWLVPSVTVDRALELLFPDAPPAACAAGADAERIHCLLGERYQASRSARKLALALYDEMGDVAGQEEEQDMAGGYRGTIHLVPALPTGDAEEHLRWVLDAQREIESFLGALEKKAGSPLPYRHRALGWRFFRSVHKHTPSAYATNWEVGYNLVGSLNRSGTAVRDTLFHELFHLNDFAHDTWSRRVIGDLVDGIVARCDKDVSCYARYAPTGTKVLKTGQYYAFQPDNGDVAHEYAAELATRYFLEQRAALRHERWEGGRFKCQAPENAQAWKALADEFFGGVDLVPACR